jgi:DNA sulfur modification protein DndD
MVNFRQFLGEQKITFAREKEHNVTVVMGENGSGKTTLAQAFTWCLYGNTDFEDKSTINRIVEMRLALGEESSVRVELELTHSNIDYTIVRQQSYRKDTSGKVKAGFANLEISYKHNGQQEFIKPFQVDNRIMQILPIELSRYFFFDGERIGKMSKEIKRGRSQEFAQAVHGLLGLGAFISALEHLKPTSKYGVIGSYNASYDAGSDKRIAEYTEKIDSLQEQLDRNDKRFAEIENEEQLARDQCEELNNELKKYAETEQLIKERDELRRKIEATKRQRINQINEMLKGLKKGASAYFAKSLIKDALDALSKADKLDKGIPDVHTRTIDFLIKRGYCICGTKIETGNGAYKELNKALEFLPPQSIGNSIAQFIKESEVFTKSSDVFQSFATNYGFVREHENRIDELTEDIQNIEGRISEEERGTQVQNRLWQYEKILRDLQAERDAENQKKGALQNSRDRMINEREKLTFKDENNKKIEIYKAYAQYLFDEISREYKKCEDETRKALEKNINEIFKEIYAGGMSLTIDEKYNIQVIVEEQAGRFNDVETSTAQSISVIFAFIAGIIKMAREASADQERETKLLDAEPYPLVMDAPLSSFDKRRVKAICDVIPRIAEQAIIFIKDIDGEIAEDNMGQKVGKRYILDKKSEFETHLLAR